VNILLVDDHTLVRKGLAQLIQSLMPGAQITEAGDADEAVGALGEQPFDVALVDVRMPGRTGLELLREIRTTWPGVPVIIVTSYDNPQYVKAALAGGAAGYLLKDAGSADLAQAISAAVSGGGSVVSTGAVRSLISELHAPGGRDTDGNPSSADLTPREVEVLALVSDGNTNREISRTLFMSEKTIKAHLVRVYRKLGVSNRTEAAMMSVSMGIGKIPDRGGGFARRQP
jgi:DNA-binding NarL/FixJ family response regulator